MNFNDSASKMLRPEEIRIWYQLYIENKKSGQVGLIEAKGDILVVKFLKEVKQDSKEALGQFTAQQLYVYKPGTSVAEANESNCIDPREEIGKYDLHLRDQPLSGIGLACF